MARSVKRVKADKRAKEAVAGKSGTTEGVEVDALKERLAEASEQQTAISEILRLIASSAGDLKPMLNVVVERALKLCAAADATIFLLEGDKLRSAARFSSMPTLHEVG